MTDQALRIVECNSGDQEQDKKGDIISTKSGSLPQLDMYHRGADDDGGYSQINNT